MDLGLDGKRALVLSSSRGLGRGIAEALAAEGADVVLTARSEDKLAAAADAAEEGARATTPMQARKGRASYLGERSVGHQDPGATSTALIVRALGGALVTPG